MDPSKELSESWDKNAGNWTKAVREEQIPSRRQGTDEAIVTAILDRRPVRLLDVGCGEGWLIRNVVEALRGQAMHCEAVGIDGAASLIEDARSTDPEGDYRVLDYDALMHGKASLGDPFGVIVFNYAILDEGASELLVANRSLLTPNGRIIIQTLHPDTQSGPYRDGWRTEDFSTFKSQNWQPMPWYFRTLSSWHTVIRDAGLVLEDLIEPMAEGGDRPLSLIMVCKNSWDN